MPSTFEIPTSTGISTIEARFIPNFFLIGSIWGYLVPASRASMAFRGIMPDFILALFTGCSESNFIAPSENSFNNFAEISADLDFSCASDFLNLIL